jgi:uncharacterized protein YgfB (UPF0149 family)
MKEGLSYQDLQEIVVNNDFSGSIAEFHGILSGLLCIKNDTDYKAWMENALGEAKHGLSDSERHQFLELYETTRRQLQEFDCTFQLFLPDDDCSLDERAEALREWSEGFLLGMGYQANQYDWSEEVKDILNDFIEISRLDTDTSGEEDEVAYTELTEYVRICVQVIHTEIQQKLKRLH